MKNQKQNKTKTFTDPIADSIMRSKADHKQEGGTYYVNMKVTPWDAMKVWLTPEEFRGFLKGNVIKRIARANVKDGLLDIKKAKHELDKYLQEFDTK